MNIDLGATDENKTKAIIRDESDPIFHRVRNIIPKKESFFLSLLEFLISLLYEAIPQLMDTIEEIIDMKVQYDHWFSVRYICICNTNCGLECIKD
jgi:hypothetical protein